MSLFKLDNKVDWFLLLLVTFCATAIEGKSLQIALHVILPFIFIVVGIRYRRCLFRNKSLILYFTLIIWLCICSIFAYNTEVSFSAMIKILSGLLCSFMLYHLSTQESNILWIYCIVIASFVSIMIYANNNIGLIIAETYNERLQDDVINANMFAYHLFYASFATYCIIKRLFKNSLIIELFIILVLLGVSIWLSLLTASRQILVLQIPFLLCLFAIDRFKLKTSNIVLIVLFLGIVIFCGFPLFQQYYNESLLSLRTSESVQEDSRFVILKESIKCGLSNPILGVGPGCFVLVNRHHIFSHNCFAELFACGGFIALILYVAMLSKNLKDQYRRYKETRESFFLYHFLFQFFFILDNFFYVQINSLWLMGFYFISVGHSDLYYKTIQNKMKYENQR